MCRAPVAHELVRHKAELFKCLIADCKNKEEMNYCAFKSHWGRMHSLLLWECGHCFGVYSGSTDAHRAACTKYQCAMAISCLDQLRVGDIAILRTDPPQLVVVTSRRSVTACTVARIYFSSVSEPGLRPFGPEFEIGHHYVQRIAAVRAKPGRGPYRIHPSDGSLTPGRLEVHLQRIGRQSNYAASSSSSSSSAAAAASSALVSAQPGTVVASMQGNRSAQQPQQQRLVQQQQQQQQSVAPAPRTTPLPKPATSVIPGHFKMWSPAMHQPSSLSATPPTTAAAVPPVSVTATGQTSASIDAVRALQQSELRWTQLLNEVQLIGVIPAVPGKRSADDGKDTKQRQDPNKRMRMTQSNG